MDEFEKAIEKSDVNMPGIDYRELEEMLLAFM